MLNMLITLQDRLRWFVTSYVGIVLAFSCSLVYGQGAMGIDPTRKRRVPQPLLEEKPFQRPPGTVLPPLPKPIPQKRKEEKLPLIRIYVREINVTGNTVFSPEEIARLVTPYEKRELTNEDLEALRMELTLLYVKNGYINSGAVIPDQSVADGVITFNIIEGKLTQIEVEGNRWFREGYIRKRLVLGAGKTLNMNSLQKNLRLLEQDSRIERLNAELVPGLRPGEGFLNVGVKDKLPYGVGMVFNNYQSSTIGAERWITTVSHQNLFGLGDILSLSYGRSEGLERDINSWYSIPITARDTTMTLQYRKDDSDIVQEPFAQLDVRTESEIFNLSLRHPFYRTANSEFALSVTGEYLQNETFLLHEPFQFSAGEKRGKSNITALRFTQEWTNRTQNQVLAARSRFSVGINAFGATDNSHDRLGNEIADGQFFSWLGQFQWARRLKYRNIQTLFKVDAQLANKPLLPLEQMSVGGRYSVRGYRENLMVRDNVLIASFETRVPIFRGKRWADYVELVPFVDYGKAWNETRPLDPVLKDILSIGVGVRWALTLPKPIEMRPQFEFFWGHRLNNVDTTSGGEHDLQDDGVHFQFSMNLF
ncbi:MAG: ShlB/FhaC/HecB family hemolysin secretion/activation protein [Candidatus Scalindua sp.]|nr:ShlB/FhaC/HecB family hemolysin secretion/activation protein [Candidatus Scalindua sp.]